MLRSPVEVGTPLRKDNGPVYHRQRRTETRNSKRQRPPFANENKKEETRRNGEQTDIRLRGDPLHAGSLPLSDLGHRSKGALIRHR